jgi:hypothetical protein
LTNQNLGEKTTEKLSAPNVDNQRAWEFSNSFSLFSDKTAVNFRVILMK